MVAPTFVVPSPVLLLTSLEQNCSARTNTNYLDASRFPFFWALPSSKVLTGVSPDVFTLVPVSKEQNTTNGWQKVHIVMQNCSLGLGQQTWNICQFYAVFCAFVTNAKVKGPHEVSVITFFNLSDNCSFCFHKPAISHSLFWLGGGGDTNPVGTQNEGENSHFAIVNKSTFQKVSGGNSWLHPLFITWIWK